MRIRSLLFLALMAGADAYGGDVLTANTEGGADFGSVAIGYTGKFQNENDGFRFTRWNLSGAGSRFMPEGRTGSSSEETALRTREISAGVSAAAGRAWKIDLSIYGTSTPETRYRQGGGALDVSYEFLYPFTIGAGAGGGRIRQDIEFTILATTVEREIELDQSEGRIFMSWIPLDWLMLKLDVKGYDYSRSKADLQAAYNSRFLNIFTTDLVSSIAALPEFSSSLEAIFVINSDWDVEFYSQNSHLIVDDSVANRTEIVLTRYLKSCSVGLGVARNKTSQDVNGSVLLNLTFNL